MKTTILFLLSAICAGIAAAQQNNFIPKDPWREIDGEKVYAKGTNWVHFSGRVLEVQPGGIKLMGFYGPPPHYTWLEDEHEFFIANFPYQCAENEMIDARRNFTAKQAGVFTYTTVLGGSATLRKLDYGTPCEIPDEAIQKANAIALRMKLEKETAASEAAYKKKIADVKTFMWLQSLATNGSASAQCGLGLHYLNGQGCETNQELAAKWLKMAAGNGDIEASNTLQRLKP